jgi:hypothetical protein
MEAAAPCVPCPLTAPKAHGGSSILPPPEATPASKGIHTAYDALLRASKAGCPTGQQLRASVVLYTGPSATGLSEAAHAKLNEVFGVSRTG